MRKRIGPLSLIRCRAVGHDWQYCGTDPFDDGRVVRFCPRCQTYQDRQSRRWAFRPRPLKRLGAVMGHAR